MRESPEGEKRGAKGKTFSSTIRRPKKKEVEVPFYWWEKEK